MLKTFKSSVGPDVRMFGDVADQLLEVIGKPGSDQGVISVEQMGDALARLRSAVDSSRRDTVAAAGEGGPGDDESDAEHARSRRVSLAQRAQPLIELLERSLRANKPVVWGF